MAKKTLEPKIKKIAERYIKHLRAGKYPITQAFVFGSRVRGNAHPDSDLDIAIISPRITNAVVSNADLLCKAHDLDLKKEGIYIEPHGFHPDNFVDENPLAWEIKQTGIPVE